MIDWDTPVPLSAAAIAWLDECPARYQVVEVRKMLDHIHWQAARIRALEGGTMNQAETDMQTLKDEVRHLNVGIERAWGIIANAGGGEWKTQTDEWQSAAERWRDRFMLGHPDPEAHQGQRAMPDFGWRTLEARNQHLQDIYRALGIEWGQDPFAAIAALQDRAAAPRGPAPDETAVVEIHDLTDGSHSVVYMPKTHRAKVVVIDAPDGEGATVMHAGHEAILVGALMDFAAYYFARQLQDHGGMGRTFLVQCLVDYCAHRKFRPELEMDTPLMVEFASLVDDWKAGRDPRRLYQATEVTGPVVPASAIGRLDEDDAQHGEIQPDDMAGLTSKVVGMVRPGEDNENGAMAARD